MGAAKAHEYMALGNLSERSKVIRSDSDDEDSEDEEIVYCRSDDLDSSAENNERVCTK